jgi:hypothetical protein
MGCLTVTAAGGHYTANGAALTQTSSSGNGTGATFNTVKYGVDTFQLVDSGIYSVLPTNPVSQGSSSGSGTGFQATINHWFVQSCTASGGINYPNGQALTFSGGGGTLAAGIVLAGEEDEPIFYSVTNFPDLPDAYSVFVTTDGPATACVSKKTNTSFEIALYPPAGAAIGASVMDIMVIG